MPTREEEAVGAGAEGVTIIRGVEGVTTKDVVVVVAAVVGRLMEEGMEEEKGEEVEEVDTVAAMMLPLAVAPSAPEEEGDVETILHVVVVANHQSKMIFYPDVAGCTIPE